MRTRDQAGQHDYLPADCPMWVEAEAIGAVVDKAGCPACSGTWQIGDALLCRRPAAYADAGQDMQVRVAAELVEEAVRERMQATT